MAVAPRDDRVQEARRLVKRSEEDQWRLAELTYAEVERGVTVKAWAAAIGYSADYINALRRVWARYGEDPHRLDRSFGEHMLLAGRSADTAEGVLDQADAIEESTGEKVNVGTFLRRSPEQRVEEVRRALNDPEVIDRIRSDRDARKTVFEAGGQIAEDMQRDAKEEQRERAPRIVNTSDAYNAAGDLSTARYRINRALKTVREMELDDDTREMLLDDAQAVEVSLGWMLSYLESGDRSFDEQLDAVLREGRG